MIRFPTLQLPVHPLDAKTITSYVLLSVSVTIFAIFWVWAMAHAARTPRAPWTQRLLWFLCLLCNPITTVWYWCVWKRWAFWTLFTPLLGIFLTLPFAVRSLMTKADATNLTNGLFALGSNGLVIFLAVLFIFPVVMRLAVILHLTKNPAYTAIERNDWVVSIGLPSVGYGAAFAYAIKHLMPWAFATLGWMLVVGITGRLIVINVTRVILPAGEEKRTEFLMKSATGTH